MGVALPDDLRSQLERDAEAAGHSIASEIRRRVASSYAADAIDPITRELIDGIIRLAESLRVDFGAPWHADASSHAAFGAALAQRVAGYKPAGQVNPHPRVGAVTAMLGLAKPEDQPDVIGRTHERHDWRSHSYPYIQAAQQARAHKPNFARLKQRATKKDDKS
jgi:hypothetical protein